MADKILIGRTKEGKYPKQVDVGLTRDDVQKLFDNLNEKGWVNIRSSVSKAGKYYTEILQPKSYE